jgi:hypothetical protein
MNRDADKSCGWNFKWLAVAVWVAAWSVWLDPVSAAPPDVCLALDGRVLQSVVVGQSASEPTRKAAADLAETLKRISGAPFQVTEGDGRSGLAVVLRSHADGIWLLGASDRAVEHAVWDLLHRWGYRLFFLTDTWEIIPERTDLHLAVDCFEKPDFLTRQAPRGAPWSDGALWNRWRTRNRITSAFSLNTGHAYDGILRANAEAFRANPEYYAWSMARGGWPAGSMGVATSSSASRIPACGKWSSVTPLASSRPTPSRTASRWTLRTAATGANATRAREVGSVSDRVVTLANEVAEAINGLGLGPKYVGIYAYNQHSPPPSIRVHPNVVVSVATSFVRGGYTIEQLVEGWAAQGAVLGVREYHDVFPWSHDMPRRARGGDLDYLARTIPYFFEHGARFMNSENSDSWGANGLGYWLSPILLWDVERRATRRALRRGLSGPGFRDGEGTDARVLPAAESRCSIRTPEDVVGRMYRALAAARGLTQSPKVHARLDDLVLYTRYVELYHAYRAAEGEARQAAFESLWRHTYRMRDRMMVSTVAICHRDRFRDRSVTVPDEADWSVPEERIPGRAANRSVRRNWSRSSKRAWLPIRSWNWTSSRSRSATSWCRPPRSICRKCRPARCRCAAGARAGT